MQANLTYEQRKALLTGLGFEVLNGDDGFCLYKDGEEVDARRDFDESEQAAWESITLDMNFCFEVAIPWMKAKNMSFVLAYHNGTENQFRVVFDREDNDNYKVDFAVHDDNPATAICLAVLQCMEAKK